MSAPVVVKINETIQSTSGQWKETSDSHKEVSNSRQQKDSDDAIKLCSTYLNQHNPCQPSPTLRNITTGVSASPNVNVDDAFVIGEKIITAMKGKGINEITFKKSNQVVTMSESHVIHKGEVVVPKMNPDALFQCFVKIGTEHKMTPEEFISY